MTFIWYFFENKLILEVHNKWRVRLNKGGGKGASRIFLKLLNWGEGQNKWGLEQNIKKKTETKVGLSFHFINFA